MSPSLSRPQEPFPDDAVIIIGAGRFGSRATGILSSKLHGPVWVVDRNRSALERIGALPVTTILDDGIRFLVDHFPLLRPSNRIIPSIPCHLAFEWLRVRCGENVVHPTGLPQEIRDQLPHTWMGPGGSLLVSYADFLCPEDCPEPANRCTVTGKKRGMPLYERLARVEVEGFHVHILRSRQLAPGVGGYRFADLVAILDKIRSTPGDKWLIGTACRCHGTFTALSVDFKASSRL